MRKIIYLILLFGLLSPLISCGGGSGRVSGGVGFGVYHRHPFYSPWWGYGPGGVIVMPPDGGEPVPELPIEPTYPTPLPEIPDMGMPDIGTMDMDFGGFDY